MNELPSDIDPKQAQQEFREFLIKVKQKDEKAFLKLTTALSKLNDIDYLMLQRDVLIPELTGQGSEEDFAFWEDSFEIIAGAIIALGPVIAKQEMNYVSNILSREMSSAALFFNTNNGSNNIL